MRQLLAGDIESNPGPKPTLKPFYTHSFNTLIHQSNPLIHPQPHSPPAHSPPNSPTSVPIPSAKYTHIPQSIYSTAHTYIPQATYWTSGCLPREWRPCWSGGRDAWQGFSKETGRMVPLLARWKGRLAGLP